MELFEGFILGLLAVWALLPDLWNRWRSRDVLRKGGVGNKVALTFDDGPDPVYTPRILEILARWGVSATFFMVAENARRYPEVVKQVVAGGHEVGSSRDAPLPILVPVAKTVTPGDPGVGSHAAGLDRRSGTLLPAAMGHVQPGHPLLDAPVRPKGGVVVAGFAGLVLHDSGESHHQESVPLGTTPGAIILFHDGPGVRRNAAALVEALPQLLESMLERGLVPVTVSELVDEGERMRKRNDCRECCDESVGNRQAPLILHYSADRVRFYGVGLRFLPPILHDHYILSSLLSMILPRG